MAINWMESFEPYNLGNPVVSGMTDGLWIAGGGTGNPQDVSTEQARTGSKSLKVARATVVGTSAIRRPYISPVNTAGVGVGVFFEGFNVDNSQVPIAFWSPSGDDLVSIRVDSIGRIIVHGGAVTDPVQVSTTSPVITTNTWSHIEAKLTVGESGTIAIRVNNAEVINATVDTTVRTSQGIGQVAIYQRQQIATVSENDFFVDDIVAWDTTGTENNDFLGDRRVYTIYPDAESTPADWTVAGDASDAVDAVASGVDDAGYIETDTVDDVHQFTLENLPTEVIGVDAIQVFGRFRKDDAGTNEATLGIVDSTSASSEGSSKSLGTDFSFYTEIFNEAPSGAWTPSLVNGLELNVKRSA